MTNPTTADETIEQIFSDLRATWAGTYRAYRRICEREGIEEIPMHQMVLEFAIAAKKRLDARYPEVVEGDDFWRMVALTIHESEYNCGYDWVGLGKVILEVHEKIAAATKDSEEDDFSHYLG